MAQIDTFAIAANQAIPVEIDSNSASITVRAIASGRIFLVFDLFLQTEADCDLQIRSGATDITGPILFSTATTRERRWSSSGFPVFRGVASGDDFIIGNASTVQVNGWALLYEVEAR